MRKKIRLQGKLIIAMAAILGISGTTVGALALFNQSKTVTVESFTGKEKKVVETWRKDNEISVDQVVYSYEYDEVKDKDIVLKQSIKSGTVFKSDDTLKITLSKGADPDKEFELPDFTGKTEKEVKAWFTDNKFTTVTYSYELSDTVEPETFISMDPEAGTKVKRSAEIKVTICTPLDGKEVLVPALASMSRDEIISWADQNRINVSFIEMANDTISEGSIISVSVNEGSRLNPGDTIKIEVSTGPADQGDDRYNAQEKDNSQTNVTPPADSNVSGGQPSGTTTPSDGQQTDNTVTPPDTGNENNTPVEQVYTVPDYTRIVMIAKNESDMATKQTVLQNFFRSKNIPDNVYVINIDPNGVEAGISVNLNVGDTCSASSPIIVTIIDVAQ